MPAVTLTDAVAAPALFTWGRLRKRELVLWPLRLIDNGTYLRRYGTGAISSQAAWFLVWLASRGAMPFCVLRRRLKGRNMVAAMQLVFAMNADLFNAPQGEGEPTTTRGDDLRDLCSVAAEALHKTPNELALLTPQQILAMQKPDTDVPHFGSLEAWRKWRDDNYPKAKR